MAPIGQQDLCLRHHQQQRRCRRWSDPRSETPEQATQDCRKRRRASSSAPPFVSPFNRERPLFFRTLDAMR
jgi:hypothetical protein